MTFMTEKEQENLLELETRTLRSKEGKAYRFTMPKMYWRSYDIIIKDRFISAESLIESCRNWDDGSDESVHDLFPATVWSRHEWLERLGHDVGHVPPRPPDIRRNPYLFPND